MPVEPPIKRVVSFIDGQNLFYQAKDAFGFHYPNYDPLKLVDAICNSSGWLRDEIHFYTGIPSALDNPLWNHFWNAKMAVMGRLGIRTFSRELRYQNKTISLSDGTLVSTIVGQEKGIDVRIALDLVRYALENKYDVALVFSQDQDLSEAVGDIKKIATLQSRWIKVACAYPVSPASPNKRGINGTDWIKIDRSTYAACLDPNDYRPQKP